MKVLLKIIYLKEETCFIEIPSKYIYHDECIGIYSDDLKN